MNQTLQHLLQRKSIRAYEPEGIGDEAKQQILAATLRAPTAGGMMLYTIIEVSDQSAKEVLVKTCDNQPFIAKAPWVLLFLADYQRWFDTFRAYGVEALCEEKGVAMRRPAEGDLLLACCDALIAAQTAVVAAESLGIGSCYIGDIMENYERHKALFGLPQYVIPIALVCFGYPTQQQRDRPMVPRFAQEVVVHLDRYKQLDAAALMARHQERAALERCQRPDAGAAENLGQAIYARKFDSDFSREMTRSVRAMIKAWVG